MHAVLSVFSRLLFFVELTSYSLQYTILIAHHHERSVKPDSKSSQQFELAPTSQISISSEPCKTNKPPPIGAKLLTSNSSSMFSCIHIFSISIVFWLYTTVF
jgi:hypothetical protein